MKTKINKTLIKSTIYARELILIAHYFVFIFNNSIKIQKNIIIIVHLTVIQDINSNLEKTSHFTVFRFRNAIKNFFTRINHKTSSCKMHYPHL